MSDLEPVTVTFRGFKTVMFGKRVKDYPGVLPSVNDIGISGRNIGSGENHVYTKAKKLYAKALHLLLAGEPGEIAETSTPPSKAGSTSMGRMFVPVERDGELPHPMGAVRIEGMIVWGDQIERDQGNFDAIISKFWGDVLEAGGWLRHDDWTRFQVGNIVRGFDEKLPKDAGYTVLTFFPSLERIPYEDVTEREPTPAGLF